MKILVNALSVKEGGPFVVLEKLIAAAEKSAPEISWIIVCHPSVKARTSARTSAQLLTFPWAEKSPLHLIYWYEVTLPGLVRRLKPNVLFSQTNYLPRRSVASPTLLLEQHAGHFSPLFERLTLAQMATPVARWSWHSKRRWVRNSVEQATGLTVQTAALADDIAAQTSRPRSQIAVIPHGPGAVSLAAQPKSHRTGQPWRIGCLTKPGVQKNLGVLIEACARLHKMGRSIKLVLTLGGADYSAPVLQQCRTLGCAEIVEDHGGLTTDQMQQLYDSLDVYVFPSLCESFGFPMVEAMARGLPILVADTKSNREVTGGLAPNFAADDPQALCDNICELMQSPEHYATLATALHERAGEMTWQRAAAQTVAELKRLSGIPG